MHMLPGWNTVQNFTGVQYETNLTNRVWNFDLETQEWDIQTSGIQDKAEGTSANVAFDTRKQARWYYAWFEASSSESERYLYRLDRRKESPTKVDYSTQDVMDWNHVYLENIGDAGVLVQITSLEDLSTVPMVNQIVPFGLPSLTNTLSQVTVDVLDIATDTWFSQPVTAHEKFPADRIWYCSVAASAEDSSSHNIYIYGGGNTGNPPWFFDIIILTLPAFLLVSVYPSVDDTCPDNTCELHQIFKHKCLKVHEKHMVAYHGSNFENRCDNDPVLNKFQGMTIYDMSSLTWTTKVELENQKYFVPNVLHGIIGGK